MNFVPSSDDAALIAAYGDALHDIAARAILHGLGRAPDPMADLARLPEALHQHRATFVTLETGGQLRGCVGSAMACRPVGADVAANAHGAAFRDPRFAPLQAEEWASLAIGISLVSPMEPMSVVDEADLLAHLRPGIDGIMISEGQCRGLFLPQVWEKLPAPRDFILHLKHKAGLPLDQWSPTIVVQRFTVAYLPTRAPTIAL
jgi:AmmeMemoRadiSam system protein A